MWGAELGLNTICTQIYQEKCTLHRLPKTLDLHGCGVLWERFIWLSGLLKNTIYCTAWMNCIPGSSSPLPVTVTSAVELYLHGEILYIWVVLCYELILLCGTIWPYCSPAIQITPKALLNEISLWRVKPWRRKTFLCCHEPARGNEVVHLTCRQENGCGTSRYSRLSKKNQFRLKVGKLILWKTVAILYDLYKHSMSFSTFQKRFNTGVCGELT